MKHCGWRGNKTLDNMSLDHKLAYERGMSKLLKKHTKITQLLRRINDV